MADRKLSSVSAVSDMNFVYAETSSGETVKISKADLASVVAGLMSSSEIIGKLGYIEYSGNMNSLVMKTYYITADSPIHKRAVGGVLIVEYSIAGSEWQNSYQGRLVFYTTGWKQYGVHEEGTGMNYTVSFAESNANEMTITLTPKNKSNVYLRYKSSFTVTIS